jgi:hypothetical protein
MPRMRLATFLLISLLLACVAREGSPDLACRALARAVAERDSERAWALLSSDTQAWLEARAKKVAAAAPGVVPPSGEQLLLGTASRKSRPIGSVLVLRESRDRAVVEVAEEGGEKHEVELVREGGWRVRIPPPDQG